ncbi:hypothetical protein SCOR_34435 [Sulfidibacter corallicola]|uniref:Uncharacterized protein n=1 Tax=Sulfidibacter corallicola TaxID=2818388 RepID=A0A8A4TS43_SULCO|nr:hypothetical protein [Sulfidibacter corallicola]QTD49365.1 hypothetical protein J3U87_27590 [Sulfidibacter corallicola]
MQKRFPKIQLVAGASHKVRKVTPSSVTAIVDYDSVPVELETGASMLPLPMLPIGETNLVALQWAWLQRNGFLRARLNAPDARGLLRDHLERKHLLAEGRDTRGQGLLLPKDMLNGCDSLARLLLETVVGPGQGVFLVAGHLLGSSLLPSFGKQPMLFYRGADLVPMAYLPKIELVTILRRVKLVRDLDHLVALIARFFPLHQREHVEDGLIELKDLHDYRRLNEGLEELGDDEKVGSLYKEGVEVFI